MLDTQGTLPLLPLTLTTIVTWKDTTQAFTPFAPELGYRVTLEDYGSGSRQQKLAELSRVGMRDIPGHPHLLHVSADARDLLPLALHEREPTSDGRYDLTPYALEVLSRLRFHVVANDYSLVAQPARHGIESGDVSFFESFYPADFWPLPIPSHMPYLYSEGLFIALPDDVIRLQSLEARFTLSAARI